MKRVLEFVWIVFVVCFSHWIIFDDVPLDDFQGRERWVMSISSGVEISIILILGICFNFFLGFIGERYGHHRKLEKTDG